MAAYVILDIEIKDPAGYAEYQKRGAATLQRYGGKPLARGGATEVWEGTWQPRRVVMVEFPSMEEARRWYQSPEYQEARQWRQKAAVTNVVLVEGI